MALIKTLPLKTLERNGIHDAVDATYSVFSIDGQRYLQIDSYGRPDREHPGKRSQSIQLDRESALTLLAIIKREFQIS